MGDSGGSRGEAREPLKAPIPLDETEAQRAENFFEDRPLPVISGSG